MAGMNPGFAKYLAAKKSGTKSASQATKSVSMPMTRMPKGKRHAKVSSKTVC